MMHKSKFLLIGTALLGALLSPGLLATAEGTIVQGEAGRNMDAYLTRLAEYGFNGAFLFAKDGEVALAKGYGLADREKNIPVTTETVFTVGSITKQFTASAIMTLEMAGKLSVKDRIGKYFDDVPKDKRKITIHHLLTHTSGLRDIFGGDFDEMSREKIIDRAMRFALKSEPGDVHRYSNGGYSLLGAIVEIVSGKGYEEYLRDALFVPAKMDNTGYLLPQWTPTQLAVGYENGKPWGTIRDYPWADDGPHWNLRANGGIMSTIWDMYAWHKALLDEEILSADAKEKMFTQHVPEEVGGDTWFYGYGWAIATTERDTKLITHNGGNGIFFADMRRYVDDKVTIIYMTSTADLLEAEDERSFRKIAFELPYELPGPRKNRE